MKQVRMSLMIVILVFASLACQAVTGFGKQSEPSIPVNEEDSVVITPSSSDNGDYDYDYDYGGASSDPTQDVIMTSEFPMTSDAYNVIDIGDGSILYYSKMSLEDVMKFYRDEYTSRGYTEREILTVVNGGVLSMVFDGDPSGKAVVIQSVDLGDGSRTVAIRLEDV